MLIRAPVAAGRFYAADPAGLRREAGAWLEEAPGSGSGGTEALACMLPHAGYVFSGRVAGNTLGRISRKAAVLLLGPNHSGRGAALALWPDGAWRTPLGDAPVDKAGVDSLAAWPSPGLFTLDTAAHAGEHSLEVLLPFFMLWRDPVRIIPLCVREYNLERLREAGLAVASLARERREAGDPLLLAASSDMSHYLPHEEGRRQDLLALEQVLALDPEGLFRVCVSKKISMCGFAPMTILLYACKALGASRAEVTAHTSSGITGKKYGAKLDSVVGYAGVIIS